MPTFFRSGARFRTFFGLSAAGSLVLAAIAASSPVRSQDPAAEAETPLYLAMESMQASLRALRKQIDNPAESANAAATVRSMQLNAMTAFGQTPPAVEGANEKDTALWNIQFRRQIVELEVALLDLEQAIVEGRVEDAKQGYAKLNELKKLGHEKFQVEDE